MFITPSLTLWCIFIAVEQTQNCCFNTEKNKNYNPQTGNFFSCSTNLLFLKWKLIARLEVSVQRWFIISYLKIPKYGGGKKSVIFNVNSLTTMSWTCKNDQLIQKYPDFPNDYQLIISISSSKYIYNLISWE